MSVAGSDGALEQSVPKGARGDPFSEGHPGTTREGKGPMPDSYYIHLSSEIENRIRSGEFPENEKLPSERQLAAEYGVSRAVIREALRVLDEKGLLRVVVGKGNYVRLPKGDYLSGKLEDVIAYHHIGKDDIIEARQVFERALADRVLETITPDRIASLEHLCEKMEACLDDVTHFAELDADFHLRIAEYSDNRLLELLANILNQVTDRKKVFAHDDIRLRESALDEHRRMLDAFRQKDRAMLEKVLAEHIHSFGSHS